MGRERERAVLGGGDVGSAEESSSSSSSVVAGDLVLALALPFPLALGLGFAGRCFERLRLRLSYPRLRRDLAWCLGAESSFEPWVEYSQSVPLALSSAMRRLAWRAEWRPARRRSRFERVWWRVGRRIEWARVSSRRGVGLVGWGVLEEEDGEAEGEEMVVEVSEEEVVFEVSEEEGLELESESELERERDLSAL